jgi:hypothetical protein
MRFPRTLDDQWSVVAELVERRARMVSTSDSWVRIPAKTRRGICEQDTLKSTARVAIISRIACGTTNLSKKSMVLASVDLVLTHKIYYSFVDEIPRIRLLLLCLHVPPCQLYFAGTR